MTSPSSLESLDTELDRPPESSLLTNALSMGLLTPAPTTQAMATIESLPTEIMSIVLETTCMTGPTYGGNCMPLAGPVIVTVLSASDIFALRLSSRRLEHTTLDTFARRFFKSCKTVLCKWSMQRLANIIADPRFGPHIQDMVFMAHSPWCDICEQRRLMRVKGDDSKNQLRQLPIQTVDLRSSIWLYACKRVQVLKFHDAWPSIHFSDRQAEKDWIKQILKNCQRVVELAMVNETWADQIIRRFQGNSPRRFILAGGTNTSTATASVLANLLKQQSQTLEEIKMAKVEIRCPTTCDWAYDDSHDDNFLSWMSMFELMREMLHLRAIELDSLEQKYHVRHEQHIRSSIVYIASHILTQHQSLAASPSDITTRFRLGIPRSYNVRLPQGLHDADVDRKVKIMFP